MDRAQPGARSSTNRNIEFGETTGQYTDGWIVPADEPTLSSQRYTSLDETAFNEFDAAYSADSLTVTIDPGEAFVDGWVARDVSTEIVLEPNTSNQLVTLGWDPEAIYDEARHATRDAADRLIIDHGSKLGPTVPHIPIWSFNTDNTGVTSASDHRQVGPTVAAKNTKYDTKGVGAVDVIGEDAVTSREIDRILQVVDDPERKWSVELDDNESAEIQVYVEDGETLSVYRWGAYDGNSGTAPTGLNVEILDENDAVQQQSNTVDEYNKNEPIASIENTTGDSQIFVLRAKNATGNSIGDGDGERGVGVHFGYLVEGSNT